MEGVASRSSDAECEGAPPGMYPRKVPWPDWDEGDQQSGSDFPWMNPNSVPIWTGKCWGLRLRWWRFTPAKLNPQIKEQSLTLDCDEWLWNGFGNIRLMPDKQVSTLNKTRIDTLASFAGEARGVSEHQSFRQSVSQEQSIVNNIRMEKEIRAAASAVLFVCG